MEEYPYFRKCIAISFFGWVITLFFWRSFVAAFCIASLPIIVGMIWRKDETPVFSLALTFQWLQVSIGIIWRDMAGTYLSVVDNPKINLACYLGIISIIMLAIGIRIGFSLIKNVKAIDYIEEITQTPYSLGKIFLAYGVILLIAPTVLVTSIRYAQFGTILRPIVTVQHFLLFLLFSLSIIYNRFYYAIIALILEIGYGMTGYFSGYKSAILILIIATLTVTKYSPVKRNVIVLTSLLLLFVLSMIWVGIKPVLRGQYHVERFDEFSITGEKVGYIYRLGQEFIKEEKGLYERGTLNSLAERMSSIYFFSCTLEMVPFWIPHEKGKLFFKTVKHIVTPRLLFPKKEPLGSDSVMTLKYTGAWVAGEEERTNVGLGYPVENYIDFGIPGMFVPVLLLGIVAGVFYRNIFRISTNTLLANALASSIFFFHFYLFESANIKLWGGLISNYAIIMVLFTILQRRILAYLRSRRL